VGRDLGDDVGDPVEVEAAVEADATVDVVARDGQAQGPLLISGNSGR